MFIRVPSHVYTRWERFGCLASKADPHKTVSFAVLLANHIHGVAVQDRDALQPLMDKCKPSTQDIHAEACSFIPRRVRRRLSGAKLSIRPAIDWRQKMKKSAARRQPGSLSDSSASCGVCPLRLTERHTLDVPAELGELCFVLKHSPKVHQITVDVIGDFGATSICRCIALKPVAVRITLEQNRTTTEVGLDVMQVRHRFHQRNNRFVQDTLCPRGI